MEKYELYLYHHGIKGMKWGVRRTAKQLGHVVSTGYKKAKNAAANAKAKKAEEAKRNKPIKKLTDSELKERINRLQLENQAFNLQRNMSSLNGDNISRGKKFLTSVAKDVAVPALKNASKEVLERWLKKQGYDLAGLKDTQYGISQLEKEFNKSKLKRDTISNQQKVEQTKDWFKKREEEASKKAASEKADRDIEKTIKKAERKAEKSEKKAEKERRKSEREDNKVYTGKVSGEGTSRRRETDTRSKKPDDYYKPIETEFVDFDATVSSVRNASSYQTGLSYVKRLLLTD